MPRTFFARHTDVICVPPEIVAKLYDDDRIFVHFPRQVESGPPLLSETAFWHQRASTAKTAYARLQELNTSGGLVWAQYNLNGQTHVKIGRVQPGSFKAVQTSWRWGSRAAEGDAFQGRKEGEPTWLKTVKLHDVRTLEPADAMHLRVARPQQGTLVHWRACGDGLERLLAGKPPPHHPTGLPVDQFEVLCGEYLRHAPNPKPIRIQWVVQRTGGSRADVDVVGINAARQFVLVQVTLHEWGSQAARDKLQKLRPYLGRGSAVLFCQSDEPKIVDGVHVLPIQDVHVWMKQNDLYGLCYEALGFTA